MNDEKKPYVLEIDNEGCTKCGEGRTWTIVDLDGFSIGQSWGGCEAEVDAEEMAGLLNSVYEKGQASMTKNPKKNFKIICIDNFDRDVVPDQLVAENLTEHVASIIVSLLNEKEGKESPDFYKSVPANYKLNEGFKP
jgi:hypothetical protein